MKVNVELIRKEIFNFEVEAVLNSDGGIDEEATKDKAYYVYCEAIDKENLHDYLYDVELQYGDIEEVKND